MKISLIALAIIFTFSSSPLISEELIIVGDDNARPKNWLTAEGKARGIQIALLQEISKRTGIEFIYELVPWKRAYVLSLSGKAAIIGFSKTKEREQHWYFSVPLFSDELVFVARRGDLFKYSSLEDLSGRVVGIKSGATYGDDFEQAKIDGHFKVVETTDRVDQLKMLLAGRLDLVLVSPGRISFEMLTMENDWLRDHREDFIVLTTPYKVDQNYIGIPKTLNRPRLVARINMVIREMKIDGTYDRIVAEETKKFFGHFRTTARHDN